MKAYARILLLTIATLTGIPALGQAVKYRSNIDLNGNKITTSQTNGSIVLEPNGTGTVRAQGKFDVDNIQIDGNTIYSTDVNGDIWFVPNGTGEMKLSNQLTIFNNAGVLITDDDGSNFARVKSTGALTGNREIALPDATTTLVGTDAVQVITNKDIDGGTASNTKRLTIPKNAKASLDALTRKEATLVYATDTAKAYIDNGSTLTAIGSGSGAGEINAVTNPNAETDVAGYADSDGGADVSRDTTTANLALYPTITTGVKVNADAATEYISYCGTMPAGLKNRKLKLEWFQVPESGYASGDQKLEVYSTTSSTCASSLTRLALSTDASGVTAIPNATGKFTTTADTNSDGYFQIRWVRVSGTKSLTLQNIIYGPGIQPQGAVVTAPVTYTPTVTLAGGASASDVSSRSTWAREGEYMLLDVDITFTVSSATPTGVSISIPPNHTIGGNTNQRFHGNGDTFNLTANRYDVSFTAIQGDTAIIINLLAGNSFNAPSTGRIVRASLKFPISEWAGSGTLNVAQNDVEYAYNTSSTDADDTTSFGYGPQGTAGVMVTTNLTASRNKRVRFQSSIQATDAIWIEVFDSTANAWFPIHSNRNGSFSYSEQNGVQYGIYLAGISSTDVNVIFARYAIATGATYGAAGANWSGVAAGSKWRVVKAKSGSAVGFGAATATQMGLVKGGQVPGTNTNDNANAGNVGEYIDSGGSNVSLTPGTATQVHVYNLPAGDWDVWGNVTFSVSGADSTSEKMMVMGISLSSATYDEGYYEVRYGKGFNISGFRTPVPVRRISLSSTTPVYLNAQVSTIAGTVGTTTAANPRIFARRRR